MQQKKLYYFSDDGFLDMKTRFVASLKDDFDHRYQHIEVNLDSEPGGGVEIWKYKTEMIIGAITDNLSTGEVIIVSDIDIIFFKPVGSLIDAAMVDQDIVFQREFKARGVNIGFIAIRCNQNSLGFWKEVYRRLLKNKNWDQKIVNNLLYKFNYTPLRWDRFPRTIWSWSQGKRANLKKDIHLHHANCVSDKQGKFSQMDEVVAFVG